jgi:hypothetical protein
VTDARYTFSWKLQFEETIVSTKNIIKLLVLLNFVLLVIGVYLFQERDPSNIVRFGRTFIVGTNAAYMLINLWLYRKEA